MLVGEAHATTETLATRRGGLPTLSLVGGMGLRAFVVSGCYCFGDSECAVRMREVGIFWSWYLVWESILAAAC